MSEDAKMYPILCLFCMFHWTQDSGAGFGPFTVPFARIQTSTSGPPAFSISQRNWNCLEASPSFLWELLWLILAARIAIMSRWIGVSLAGQGKYATLDHQRRLLFISKWAFLWLGSAWWNRLNQLSLQVLQRMRETTVQFLLLKKKKKIGDVPPFIVTYSM